MEHSIHLDCLLNSFEHMEIEKELAIVLFKTYIQELKSHEKEVENLDMEIVAEIGFALSLTEEDIEFIIDEKEIEYEYDSYGEIDNSIDLNPIEKETHYSDVNNYINRWLSNDNISSINVPYPCKNTSNFLF